MWKNIDKIKIADKVMTGILILVITTMIYLAVIKPTKENDNISVPHDYHIIYDDEHQLLIVPNEYHFKTNEKGATILTK